VFCDYPKFHGNNNGKGPDNYTSFLPQDKPFGPFRAQWNPILWKLKRCYESSLKPTDFVKVDGRVVLDAFDHGIRDFGDALPLCISSEVQGHDVETYMRRNSEMTYYDLVGMSFSEPSITYLPC
jgi:hypothetical protein